MIAFDAYSAGAEAAPGSAPMTFNHTCTGSNRVLYVIGKGAGVVTGVTYNGVAMTKIVSAADPNYGTIEVWRLFNPASGTNQVSATWSGSQYVSLSAISYTGSQQVDTFEVTATEVKSTAGTSISDSLTLSAANCWILVGTITGPSVAISSGSGYTTRGNASNTASTNYEVMDSNGNVTSGSNTHQTDFGVSVASCGQVMVTIVDVDQPAEGAFLLSHFM